MKRLLFLFAIILCLPVAAFAVPVPDARPVTPFTDGVSSPVRLAADGLGNLYVADPRAGGVVVIDAGGKVVKTLSLPRPPQGVAVTSSGSVLVSQGDYVSILNASGTETGRLGSGAGQFRDAAGIAVDGAGMIYVADSLAGTVQVFNPSGSYRTRFGTPGSSQGQLAMPTGITWEKALNILAVADTLNGRVQFFDTAGNWVRTIGSAGSGPLRFNSPQGVAFDYAAGSVPLLKRMYVLDSFQGMIQAIDPAGSTTFLGYIGSYGTGAGQMETPSDLLFVYPGKLAVANGTGSVSLFAVADGTGAPPDTAAPKLAIDPVPFKISADSYRLTGTVEAGSTVTVTLENGGQGSAVVSGTTWSYTVTGLQPGANTVVATAIDATGNTTRSVVTIGVDTTFVITSSAGSGGAISQSASVAYGGSTTFTMTPTAGYHVADVLIDGVSVGAVGSYTFSLVTSAHTIQALFANSWNITASMTGSGTITPAGTVSVASGSSRSYTITPAAGYHVADVVVDGASKGALRSFTFRKVSEDHTIAAVFSATWPVTATAAAGGSITPLGTTQVDAGGSVTYTVTPDPGYRVAAVKVNGASKGAVTSVTVANVTGPRTVTATFAAARYTLASSAGSGGRITPSVTAGYGASATFTITPAAGHHVADVLVDGNSVGAVTSYTFDNVAASHTIRATFAGDTFTITATAGAGGSITPTATVSYGASKSFVITPDKGQYILNVRIDGVSKGRLARYTFSSVKGNHTIEAYFSGANSVDTTPPEITLSALADGSVTRDEVINLSGTASDTLLDRVTVNGVQADLVNGLFSGSAILSPGANDVTVAAYDKAGNVATATRRITFTPAAAPAVITAPGDGAHVSGQSVTVTGTSEPGAAVTAAGVPVTVTDGGWNASVAVMPGMNTIDIVATAADGRRFTAKRTIFADPAAPEVSVSAPADDLATAAAQVAVAGTASPGATVSARVNGAGVAVTAADGTYSFTVPLPADGLYVVEVTATDSQGRAATAVRMVIRDTVVPVLAIDAGAVLPVLTGTVEPGAVVAASDRNGSVAATVTVTDGAWKADFSGTAYDSATLVITATDAAGNTSSVPVAAR